MWLSVWSEVAQLMPLPLTVSCFGEIQIGFTSLVPAHPGSPGKGAIKRLCLCVCVCVCVCVYLCVNSYIAFAESFPAMYLFDRTRRPRCINIAENGEETSAITVQR